MRQIVHVPRFTSTGQRHGGGCDGLTGAQFVRGLSYPGVLLQMLFSPRTVFYLNSAWIALVWVCFFAWAHASTEPLAPLPSDASVYFVDPQAGNDAHSGLSADQAWRTLTQLNAVSLKAGDEVRLKSGAQFEERLYLGEQHTGTAENPVIITTDGPTPATILAGDGSGVLIYNTGGMVFENLILEGSGMATNTDSGFMFYTDLPGRREAIVVRDVSVSGFGEYGLYMSGYRDDEQLSGFLGLTVTRGVFFENELGGMFTWAGRLYGIENVHVSHSTFHSNPGRPNDGNPSGSGVVLGRTDGGVIEYSVAYNNGAANTNSAGPVAIWAYDSNNVVIQHNLAYENRSAGGDGGGFDLDGGATNSVMQYNFSYNNDGAGYLLAQYLDAPAFGGNVVRYNISQNDGRRGGYGGITLWAARANNPVMDTEIYHNTVYVTEAPNGTPAAVRLFGGNFQNIALRNNLFIADGRSGVNVIDADQATRVDQVRFQGNGYFHFNRSGTQFVYGANTYTDLNAWRETSNQERLNDVAVGHEADPGWCVPLLPIEPTTIEQLASMKTYRLSSQSLMRDQGLDLVGDFSLSVGEQDFFGHALSDGAADIGAHEYIPGDCDTVFRDSFSARPF